MRDGKVIAQGAPASVLTPENLEAAYGRKGRLIDVEGKFAAVFD